jgi:signal peptidase I
LGRRRPDWTHVGWHLARLIREFLLSLILATALFLVLDAVASRNWVDGPSMEPLLQTDQRLLIGRVGLSGPFRSALASGPDESSGPMPPRGSIVTFVHPSDPTRVLVKRIVGLPGEEITITRGEVYVDGLPLDEPYIAIRDTRSMSALRVTAESVFVLGDNRSNSLDSRYFGPVPRANLLGVVILRYWPLTDLRVLLPGL